MRHKTTNFEWDHTCAHVAGWWRIIILSLKSIAAIFPELQVLNLENSPHYPFSISQIQSHICHSISCKHPLLVVPMHQISRGKVVAFIQMYILGKHPYGSKSWVVFKRLWVLTWLGHYSSTNWYNNIISGGIRPGHTMAQIMILKKKIHPRIFHILFCDILCWEIVNPS